jgi:hypothetical protein
MIFCTVTASAGADLRRRNHHLPGSSFGYAQSQPLNGPFSRPSALDTETYDNRNRLTVATGSRRFCAPHKNPARSYRRCAPSVAALTLRWTQAPAAGLRGAVLRWEG